ncbi:penicillin-binding transpeptidase domain-containing protein [Conexibacter sp. SYSU D00693]|uniref:penicillin-binding transpeptidase domain-containing protein n=1 Tax=Conexibacter sp. SYSU D00693 TaxID=2812560 RepID=UPI00196BAFB2|nr:penicillin-binding transpeptidase domain-containing protein [Conexibacter sp. SYSU D00693]
MAPTRGRTGARPATSALSPGAGRRRRPTRADRLRRRALPLAALLVVVGGGTVVAVSSLGSDERQELVDAYVRAWAAGDYAAMHDRLTDRAKNAESAVAFARDHRRALATATAEVLRFGEPTERDDGRWTVDVAVRTRVFGTLRGPVVLPVEEDGDALGIAWTSELVFPGLKKGERLRRTTTLPERASILARDGSPLASGPDRSSPLAAASDIRGSLGPAPDERQEALRKLGVPADAQVGINGLERIFDDRLHGTPGGELRAGSRLIATARPRKAPAVRTTIAPSVQTAAVTALAGRLGGVVAVRPRTGEVLAAAGIGFSGLQPPGSTFKVITAAAALEAGKVSLGKRFPVQTAATLEGVDLQNANGEACGGTFLEAFAESCNSVFAPLGAEVGAARLVKTAEAFGFNQPPAIPGAATSTIPRAGEIGDDLAVGSSAIGQGRLQATALEMATVAATVALEGRRPVLTLDGRRIGERAESTRAVSARTARTLERLMREVVRSGTGTSAAIKGVPVAGKTGTAELKQTQGCEPPPEAPGAGPIAPAPGAGCDGTDTSDTTAWFTAYAPADDPEVAVGVMLVGQGAGGDTAAPAARQVLQAALG